MQITRHQHNGLLEFQVAGRLDAYWADHFIASILAAVREGHHQLRADLSAVEYISSAGLGALIKCYKELKALAGTFLVSRASREVAQTLSLVGLGELLVDSETGSLGNSCEPLGARHKSITLPNATMEVYACDSGAATRCEILGGDRVWLRTQECHCSCRQLGPGSVGIGIGAPGRDWADSHSRMGEYLAATGCVAFLPTDGGDVPDYLLSAERFVPELQTISSLQWRGTFTHLIRFDAVAGKAVSLQSLAEQILSATGTAAAGLVMVAEIDGLVGAAWCRSPALVEPGTDPMSYPQVREWLQFTTERAHSRSSGLVVGLVTQADAGALAAWVRPLGGAEGPAGHCHAVAFPYQPLPKGAIDPNTTVRGLFQSNSPRGLLHLMNDDRPVIGSGQSAFTSGACWVVPISGVDVEN